MNSNLRLGVLLTILISISAFSYFIFFRDTVSEQVAIENEIQTSTTISSTSTTLKPENTTSTTTSTSTSTTTTTTTTTTIPPNQTVIYATAQEINNSKTISYDYLKGGCKEDLIGDIQEEWVLPYELFIFNEEKIIRWILSWKK